MITRWQAFHGNNIAVAGFSGLTARRKIFQPMYVDSPHIPPAFCYRCPFEQTYPACNLLCARALGDGDSPAGAGERRRLHRRAGGGRGAGLRAGARRLLPEDPRDLRPLRRAVHRRRGHDRLGPHRQAVGHRPLGRHARHHRHRQGHDRRLHAAVRRSSPATTSGRCSSRTTPPFKAGHTLNANAVSCAGAIAVINYSLDHDLADNAAARGEQALAGLAR